MESIIGALPFDGLKMMTVLLWDAGQQEAVGQLLQNLMLRLWAENRRDVGQALRRIMEDLRDEDGDTGELLAPLASFAMEQYTHSGDSVKINTAIEIAEMAAQRTPDDHPNRASILTNLGSMLLRRYENMGDKNDLEVAISKVKMAVSATPDDHSYKAAILNNLGSMLQRKYEATGNMDDLEAAILTMERAISATPENHPDRARWLGNLGPMLAYRFEREGNPKDLEAAMKQAKMAVSAMGENDPDRARRLTTLANLLATRYDQVGNIDDLEAAIGAAKMTVSASYSKGQPDYASWLNNLGTKLYRRYERTSDIEDLEEAISNIDLAIQVTPEGSPDRPAMLSTAALMLSARSKRKGNKEDSELAVKQAEAAVSATPKRDVGLPRMLTNLANILLDRYCQTWKMDDLESAIKTTKLAVSSAPQGHRDRASILVNLGKALLSRYERTGDIRNLEEAISVAETTPKTHSDWEDSQSLLGDLLFRRYERTGNTADMEKAISIADTAVQKAPTGHPDLARRLSNLAYKLRGRYERTGNMSDLEVAISRARQAVSLTPKSHPDWPGWQNNVATTLFRRYERTISLDDLEKGILSAELAISSTPEGHPDRIRFLSNLGPMQSYRYKHTNNIHDLDAAISTAEMTVSGAPEHLPDRAMWLSNLGTLLRDRYERTHSVDDLRAAMLNAEMAVAATPKGHPDKASWLFNMANTQLNQFERTWSSDDLNAALGSYEASFECINSPALIRVQAARKASRILWLQGDLTRASSLATQAVELIPSVCSRYLSREDQQNAVMQTSGLAADCCSILLQVGNVDKALQQLEFGRGIILGYLIDGRSDLSQLRMDHPDLARTYDLLRFETSRDMSGQEPALRNSLLQERMTAVRDLEDCLRRIRCQPRYERFLLEPTLDELKGSAKDGPIVIVNITEIGSHAITVSAAGIAAIPLPITSFDAPLSTRHGFEGRGRATIDDLVQGRNQIRSLPPEMELESGNDQKLSQFLSWLWSKCVKLVIDHLYGDNPTGETLTRIWWIGTGMAGSLPFHAAGHHSEKSVENTLSHAISSYTPTIKALTFARSRASKGVELERDKTSVLVVTMPETPNQNPLHGVLKEKSAIEETIRGCYTFDALEKPTTAQVISQLRNCEIVHFACHGWSDMTNPSDSHLLLQHGVDSDRADKLTVRQVSEIDLGRAWIAYLSACSTAEIRVEQLRDEVLHLASAFQVAGFRHVIGSLWSADDETCVAAARNFYGYLSAERKVEEGSESGRRGKNHTVAEALHDAVLQVRSENLESPRLWAPYIHYGP